MKVALVTGSSRGIGKAISDRLKSEGIEVVDSSTKNLNLQSEKSIKNFISMIYNKYNKIDILINNAGICQRKDFLELTYEDFTNMININLIGTMMLTQQVLKNRVIDRTNPINIINISSVGGQRGGIEQLHYAASKAGIINFTKSLNRLYGDKGVICNTISPGLINTDMIKKIQFDEISSEKMGEPKEVSNLVFYLINQNYICGQNISINGGAYNE